MMHMRSSPCRRRRRVGSTAAIVAILAIVTTGCAPSEARPLTDDEANRLASFRFVNFREDAVTYAFTAPESVEASGLLRIDAHEHAGAGIMGTTAEPTGVFVWDEHSVFESAHLDAVQDPAAWRGRATQENVFDTVLLMALLLVNDRPENPQLLQQSAARWVGEDDVDGAPCDVFTGPDEDGASATVAPEERNVTYCIDDEGSLLKFSARFDQGDDWWVLQKSDAVLPVEPPTVVWQALDEAAAAAEEVTP